jgi:hypothetical protein
LWLAFLSATFAFAVLIFSIDKFTSKKQRNYFYNNEDEKFHYEMIFIIIFGEGTSKMPSKSSTRLIVISFVIICLILRSIYTSELFKFFHSGSSHPAVENLEDFSAKKFTFYAPQYLQFFVSLNHLKINPRYG